MHVHAPEQEKKFKKKLENQGLDPHQGGRAEQARPTGTVSRHKAGSSCEWKGYIGEGFEIRAAAIA